MIRKAAAFSLASLVLFSGATLAETLAGTIGSGAGDRWQSSWIDLRSNMHFHKGEELIITVQGDADRVLVRLLPHYSHPSSSVGIEGSIREVPENGRITVILSRDHPDIKQISVHAGKEAWGRLLGEENGGITLIAVEN